MIASNVLSDRMMRPSRDRVGVIEIDGVLHDCATDRAATRRGVTHRANETAEWNVADDGLHETERPGRIAD
jgi:hypothetical protein